MKCAGGFVRPPRKKNVQRKTVADVLAMLEREATAGDYEPTPTPPVFALSNCWASIHGMFTDKVQVEQTGPPPTINVRFGKPADETPE